jgi:phosphoribosylformylglycinamidine cyclo-ligase
MEKQTYASAGVDVSRAEMFVERLKTMAKRVQHDKLWPASGGYAAVYPVSEDRAIALSIDGVGTKLLVAHKLEQYDTIGVDLVAMCANDLICVGAKPTLFLDYFATGALQDNVADSIITGIIDGCDLAGMLLVGGETAEMPGLYAPGHYDLAGFGIGDVTREQLITGDKIRPGQKVIGIASSGIHSNGLSLARKVLPEDKQVWGELLTPTRIYAVPVNKMLQEFSELVTGMAHITGGGWRNLFRLNLSVGFHIKSPLSVPAIFQRIAEQVPQSEMYSTFNMGMGFSVICDGDTGPVIEFLDKQGLTAQEIGEVTDQPEVLTIDNPSVVLKG